MNISVIIPTLNEEQAIGQTLEQIFSRCQGFYEVLVVDGGSRDRTQEISKTYAVKWLVSPFAGRASQMNFGAERASGDVFLFLHADSLLPDNAFQAIDLALKDPKICAGGFSKTFDHHHFLLSGEVHKCKLRHRLLRTIAGDQGFFVRASVFFKVGRYPNVDVMEEFFLCKKLRRFGDLTLLPEQVKTSARRFLEKGIVRCYARMFFVSVLYYLRFPPRLLKWVYYSD